MYITFLFDKENIEANVSIDTNNIPIYIDYKATNFIAVGPNVLRVVTDGPNPKPNVCEPELIKNKEIDMNDETNTNEEIDMNDETMIDALKKIETILETLKKEELSTDITE